MFNLLVDVYFLWIYPLVPVNREVILIIFGSAFISLLIWVPVCLQRRRTELFLKSVNPSGYIAERERGTL